MTEEDKADQEARELAALLRKEGYQVLPLDTTPEELMRIIEQEGRTGFGD